MCIRDSLQGVHRRRPGLPWLAAAVGRREARATLPEAIGTLLGEQARPPTVVFDPAPLDCDIGGGRVGEVAQHLPADGGVAVEQTSRSHSSPHGTKPAADGGAIVLWLKD